MSHSQHPHPRAYLRHQRRRIIEQRLQVMHGWFFYASEPWGDFRISQRPYALRSAETPCQRRDHCCANPRRFFGYRTLQAELAILACWEQLVDLDLVHRFREGRFPGAPRRSLYLELALAER